MFNKKNFCLYSTHMKVIVTSKLGAIFHYLLFLNHLKITFDSENYFNLFLITKTYKYLTFSPTLQFFSWQNSLINILMSNLRFFFIWTKFAYHVVTSQSSSNWALKSKIHNRRYKRLKKGFKSRFGVLFVLWLYYYFYINGWKWCKTKKLTTISKKIKEKN